MLAWKQGLFVMPSVWNRPSQLHMSRLLFELRANDAEGFKRWLAIGLEELSRKVVID
jgi:hypothetical protein